MPKLLPKNRKPKSVRLFEETNELVKVFAKTRRMTFSAAIELLALKSLPREISRNGLDDNPTFPDSQS